MGKQQEEGGRMWPLTWLQVTILLEMGVAQGSMDGGQEQFKGLSF